MLLKYQKKKEKNVKQVKDIVWFHITALSSWLKEVL